MSSRPSPRPASTATFDPALALLGGVIFGVFRKISRAQVIDVSKLSGSQVKFGATVTVVDEDTEEEARYQIVGEHEADVKQGKISIASPIARALISKEVGDVVEVNTPGPAPDARQRICLIVMSAGVRRWTASARPSA